jgi:hypothetical protein
MPLAAGRVRASVDKGLAGGSLWPTAATTIPLGEIVEAHRHLESSPRFGV